MPTGHKGCIYIILITLKRQEIDSPLQNKLIMKLKNWFNSIISSINGKNKICNLPEKTKCLSQWGFFFFLGGRDKSSLLF